MVDALLIVHWFILAHVTILECSLHHVGLATSRCVGEALGVPSIGRPGNSRYYYH